MNGPYREAMRAMFLKYSRDVVDRMPPFDTITAPTLFSRYAPYLAKLEGGAVDYKELYVELMAATLCRPCWGHEALLEKHKAFEEVEKLYRIDFAKAPSCK